MAGFNSITVTGIAVADADAKQVREGLWVVKVRLATGNRDKPAEQVWYTINKWLREPSDRQLEYYQNIRKGSPVTAVGTAKLSVYTGKDGLPAGTIEVQANEMISYNGGLQADGQSKTPPPKLATPRVANEGYDPFGGG